MKQQPALEAHWAIVSKWSEESRYALWDPFEAASMIEAIQNPQFGVFQWLKQHW